MLFTSPLIQQGHRLGSATTSHNRQQPTSAQRIHDDEDRHEDHQPIIDPSIDDLTREQRRAEREAAAKARMEKNKLPTSKKKKTSSELRGPNSRNTMTWGTAV